MSRATLRARLDRVLPKPLTHVVRIEHDEPDAVRRRRRRVVAATSIAGAGLLGASLSTRPGSRGFYLSTAAVAGVWTVGGLASGPLHLGWIESRDETVRRPVLAPVATGVGVFGLFYGAALVSRRIPVLDAAISDVLSFADEGDDRLVLLTTLANGLGEEVFFRGALYAALRNHRPVRLVDRRLHAGHHDHPQPGAGARRRRDGEPLRPPAAGLGRTAGADHHPPRLVGADAALHAAALPPPGRSGPPAAQGQGVS